ncbi:MotA/TolQ/ExbB proton channel family protein [bacterium]|nr:MotA/TolQ/ExbB proton channel family protein [bacterium]
MGGILAQVPAASLPVIIVLMCLSVLSLTLIVAKTLQLMPTTRGAKVRDGIIDSYLAGNRDAAIRAAALGKAPADRVLLTALQGLDAGLPLAAVEAETTRRGNEEIAAMSSWLRLLDLISMIAPLLGLLGTVLGMIKSFQDLSAAQGSANASVLAGGIWEALITTAGGLLVAIPAAVAANLLTGRVETAALRIESAVGRLLALSHRG